jgi:hypothetical protein
VALDAAPGGQRLAARSFGERAVEAPAETGWG